MGMTEKFTNAIEAREYMDTLLTQIKACSYSPDLTADAYRAKMHESTDYVEKLILMLTLMAPEES